MDIEMKMRNKIKRTRERLRKLEEKRRDRLQSLQPVIHVEWEIDIIKSQLRTLQEELNNYVVGKVTR